ncbi:hypothetical protein RHECNPAF_730085 [Rhizobium etli CNPAF512]|nr:hypothetical protein RHECNPAF_730085 [Rhizobium etli CNPAF512]
MASTIPACLWDGSWCHPRLRRCGSRRYRIRPCFSRKFRNLSTTQPHLRTVATSVTEEGKCGSYMPGRCALSNAETKWSAACGP